MSKYIKRETRWIVAPKNYPLFTDEGFTVSVDDDGRGEYVTVSENNQSPCSKIIIHLDEWESLQQTINHAVKQCRQYNP